MEPSPEIRGRMTAISGFTQRLPDDGEPASERTDVYLAYDDQNLYAVFLAFDSDPEQIRANLSPRENVDNDDTVGILIDTFNDQRTGLCVPLYAIGCAVGCALERGRKDTDL